MDIADDHGPTRAARPVNDAVHIASLIVRTTPANAADVARRIAEQPGNEIHAVEDGKIIVVLEMSSDRALADRMDALRQEPDILLVNLVYHQMESP